MKKHFQWEVNVSKTLKRQLWPGWPRTYTEIFYIISSFLLCYMRCRPYCVIKAPLLFFLLHTLSRCWYCNKTAGFITFYSSLNMIGFSLKNSDCICFSIPASAAFSGEALVPWWLKGSEEHAGPQPRFVGSSWDEKWANSNSSLKFGDNRMSLILCTSKIISQADFWEWHMLHMRKSHKKRRTE